MQRLIENAIVSYLA